MIFYSINKSVLPLRCVVFIFLYFFFLLPVNAETSYHSFLDQQNFRVHFNADFDSTSFTDKAGNVTTNHLAATLGYRDSTITSSTAGVEWFNQGMGIGVNYPQGETYNRPLLEISSLEGDEDLLSFSNSGVSFIKFVSEFNNTNKDKLHIKSRTGTSLMTFSSDPTGHHYDKSATYGTTDSTENSKFFTYAPYHSYNVGIGTSSPKDRLHIAKDLILYTNSANEYDAFVEGVNFLSEQGIPLTAFNSDSSNSDTDKHYFNVQFAMLDPSVFENTPDITMYEGTNSLVTDPDAILTFAFDMASIKDNGSKTFVIDHPLDSSKYLVHATTESNDAVVVYSGQITLSDGKATISLPSYFSELTESGSETFSLTSNQVNNRVIIVENTPTDTGFFTLKSEFLQDNHVVFWEVKANRKLDFEVEPLKSDYKLNGSGPYTYLTRKQGTDL